MSTHFLQARETYRLVTSPQVLRWTRAVGAVLRVHHSEKNTIPKIWAYRFDKLEYLNCRWGDYCLGFVLESATPRLPDIVELFGKDCLYRCGDVEVHDMTDALMLMRLIEQARLHRDSIAVGMDVPCASIESEQRSDPLNERPVFASIVRELSDLNELNQKHLENC